MYKTIITSGLVLISSGVFAQVSKTKEVHKAFKVSQGVNIEVENKYGKIQVLTWDKDSVVIDIHMEVKAKTEEKLTKTLSNISFDIISTGQYVTAKTIFLSEKGSLFSTILDITESSFGPDDETKIDYVIYMPKKTNLTLTNKFGDVYTADVVGRVTMDIAHGDLKAGSFTGGYTKIDMRYGKANISYVQEGHLLAFYGTFDVQKADDISMESKSSEINVYQAKRLKVESKRDQYYVKSVNQFTANGSFTDFKIDQLKDEMIFDTRYGTIVVNEVKSGFNYIKLNSEYSDADISFGKGSGFSFDLEAEDVIFNYPAATARLTKTVKNNNDEVLLYNGKIGAAAGTSRVRMNMKDGGLTIKML